MKDKKIEVLYIKAEQKPKRKIIDNSLIEMQRLIGGVIRPIFPFTKEIVLVCNEGKNMFKMRPNRAIYDKNQEIKEVICGDFFICHYDDKSHYFTSLSEEEFEKYEKKFYYPEIFYVIGSKLRVLPVFELDID